MAPRSIFEEMTFTSADDEGDSVEPLANYFRFSDNRTQSSALKDETPPLVEAKARLSLEKE
jgi:hypothetical protein